MKKLIFILCLGIFLGACASVSNSDTNNNKSEEKPTLTQIHKDADIMVTSLETKEKEGTLQEDEKKFLQALRNWENETDTKALKEYATRPITIVDILTIGLGQDEGYTMEEIDKSLKLGLFIQNPYCESEFKSYEVFQVLPDYVLAHGCEITSYSKCSTSHSKIFMSPKQKDELYFDNKILIPQNDFCSTYIGVYKYESKDGTLRTVPILVFLPKVIDKGQLELIKQSREESQNWNYK